MIFKFGQIAALTLCLAVASIGTAFADDVPAPTQVDHLNIVFSVSDEDAVHEFYGEVLGLKRIANIPFPNNQKMIRYMGGATEVKFIVTGQDLPKMEGGTRTARGIRLLALLLPESTKAGVLERLAASGREVPEFTSGHSDAGGYDYSYGMAYDGDGNQVEIVFLGEGAPDSKFEQVQIGLSVSSLAPMDNFLTNVLGYKPAVTEGNIHRYDMGKTQLKFWEVSEDLPEWNGSPMSQIGINLVQSLVPDVDAVRAAVLARGGKIHTEPFALGKLATIMFVEGPDGILFEFAGPLLDRLK